MKAKNNAHKRQQW